MGYLIKYSAVYESLAGKSREPLVEVEREELLIV